MSGPGVVHPSQLRAQKQPAHLPPSPPTSACPFVLFFSPHFPGPCSSLGTRTEDGEGTVDEMGQGCSVACALAIKALGYRVSGGWGSCHQTAQPLLGPPGNHEPLSPAAVVPSASRQAPEQAQHPHPWWRCEVHPSPAWRPLYGISSR